ncbi:MAG: GNAT family N-acetyltransferase [Acidimicrobiales bacterium]
MAELPPNYPTAWETHAVLSDGAPVEVRPIRPSDRELLEAFHGRQSKESIYFRFFRPRPELSDKELSHFTEVDYEERMAFVALLGGVLVAVARYEGGGGVERPEVAFFVDDAHHGRGLATLLLEYLAAAARRRGLAGFTASVLPENYAMLGVFRKAGFDVHTRFDEGVIEVEIDISVTDEASTLIAERHSRARSRSVARLVAPESVAVVGASRRPGSVGHELLRQLIDGDFNGPVHPVNPAADEVLGLRCRARLTDIGAPVDLAVVAVPADAVEAVVDDAVKAGVAGLLIVSSGFAETGAEGAEREARIVRKARDNGMRLLGPNAFGLVNTDPEIRLRALFLPLRARPGSVGLLAQSGPLGSAVLEHMAASRVGISSFVAAGNRADVSVNDLLEYWAVDESTTSILLYVENYGNLRTFAGTAHEVSTRKPIVSLRPPDPNLFELLEQAGVILVDGVAELAQVARVTSTQPLPRGRRVAVVANAASVARLTAAACRRHGLTPVVPSSIEQPESSPGAASDTILVADVDRIAVAGTDGDPDYERIVVAAAVSADVDAVLIVLVPTLELSLDDLSGLLGRVNRSIDKPVVAAGLVDADLLAGPDLPVFDFPEEAARTLGRLADYAGWRGERGSVDAERVAERRQAVGRMTSELRPTFERLAVAEPDGQLTLWSPEGSEVVSLLELPVPPWGCGGTLDELAAAADEIGYPVVLKAGGHRTRTVGEAGGTAIDIHDRHQLRAAHDRMAAVRGPDMFPAVVQRMVPVGSHVRIELTQDPSLGAFARIGLGGAAGVAMPAASRRFLPLVGNEAAAMVGALSGTVVVTDDEAAILTALLDRLALTAMAVPELSSIVLDPVLLAGPRSGATDFRIVVRPWQTDPWIAVRRL